MTVDPVLYLDIDGVVNIIKPRKQGTPHVWPDVKRLRVRNPYYRDNYGIGSGMLNLHLSKMMARNLMALDCDIEWLTTWGHYSHEFVGEWLEMPEDTKVTASPSDIAGYTASGLWIVPNSPAPNWKVEAIRRDQEENPRPFIFADDELADEEARTWLDGEVSEEHIYVIPNRTDGGITFDHITAMEDFLSSL